MVWSQLEHFVYEHSQTEHSRLMTSYEARFFFIDPNNAHSSTLSVLSADDLIGSKLFPCKPRDEDLRREARGLIMRSETHIARTETHSVVADVGIDKSSGGLGASHPQETVILFKPSA